MADLPLPISLLRAPLCFLKAGRCCFYALHTPAKEFGSNKRVDYLRIVMYNQNIKSDERGSYGPNHTKS
jgi:hypothetical protein